MADPDDDDWITVSYGNRRRRNKPSYAEVTRRPPRRDLSSNSVSYNRRNNGQRQQYRNQRYDYRDSRPPNRRPQFNRRFQSNQRTQYNRRPQVNQRTQFNQRNRNTQRDSNYGRPQSNSRSRGREPPSDQWWRSADRTTRRVQDRTGGTNVSHDPDFTTKVRLIYKLIKAVHHLENVSQDHPPVTINRMTHTLSIFIKPAVPTDNTLDLITGNAKNWALTTVLILKDHYTDIITRETARLLSFAKPDWKEPFNVAANWARRNLGRRLLPDTVQRAEALLIAGQADKGTTNTNAGTGDDTPTTVTIATDPAAVLPPAQVNRLVVTADIHQGPTTSQTQGSSSSSGAPVPPPPAPAQPPPVVVDPTTVITPAPLDPIPQVDDPPKEQRIRRTQPTRQTKGTTVEAEQQPQDENPPQGDRKHRPQPPTSTPKTTASTDPNFTVTKPPPPSHPPLAHSSHTQYPLDLNEEDLITVLESSGELTPKPGTVVSALKTKTHQPQISFGTSGRAEADASLHSTTSTTPQIPMRRPTRHINTMNKIKNWSLAVREKWLILGDSNVSRFPPYRIAGLQIDSFPGATFRHMQGVLAKIKPVTTVESVILSLGINNRNQMAQTSIKELQKLLRTTKLKFPFAEVWVPLISFSRGLPPREQCHLHALNKYISSNYQSISELSRSEFSTERDGIHWTHNTAARLLRHWTQQGN